MSEAALTWVVAGAAATAIWVPYFVRFRRRMRSAEERKAEASALRIDRPIAQYPYVDPFRCAGCATCVEVCPEGDVLGVVGGMAVIINGLRCIGIGECEAACPVGAIEVGLGDLKSRDDIPMLDDRFQTTLPGVFVAGELGGMALVSNAVRQGRAVVEEVTRFLADAPGAGASAVHDLAIVGAGPAGLSAGLSARAAGLSYLILERAKGLGGTVLNYPRKKMVLTQPVELPPWGKLSKDSYEKEDLLALFERLVEESELEVEFDRPVERIRWVESASQDGGHYEIESTEGRYGARCVLLALGRRGRPRRLGVPGEEQARVMYALLDAASYSGKKILVVGGGDSAVEAAMALARDGRNDVALSYRKEKLVRIKKRNQEIVERMIREGSIQPLFGSQVEEITEGAVRLRLAAGDALELENDYVLVCIGGEPPFKLLRDMGIRFGGQPQ